MPSISLGTTDKRKNSTAVPGMSWSGSCVFKRPTSLMTPTVQLKMGDPTGYNVMYLMGRYYWITDWVSLTTDIWEITGEIDPLATCQSDILASDAFIEYSASTFEPELPDPRVAAINSPDEVNVQSAGLLFGGLSSNYILTAVGANGCTNTFCMSEGQIADLANDIDNWLNTLDTPKNVTDVMSAITWLGDQVSKLFGNLIAGGSVMDSISSCIRVPFTPYTGASKTIYLGDYQTGVSAPTVRRGEHLVDSKTAVFTLANNFADNVPYASYKLYLPYLGIVNVPNDIVIKSQGNIYVMASFAAETGELVYLLQGSDGNHIATYGANAAAAFPIGKSNVAPGVKLATEIGVSAAIATMNPAAIAASLASAVGALTPSVQTINGIGSLAATNLGTSVIAITERKTPTAIKPGREDSYNAINGRPLQRTMTIGSLSGYVQTIDAHIVSDQPESIVRAAEALLDGGVYIE